MDTPLADLYNVQHAQWQMEADLQAALASVRDIPEAGVAAIIKSQVAGPRAGVAAVAMVTTPVPGAMKSYTLAQCDNDTHPAVMAVVTKTWKANSCANMMRIIMNRDPHINVLAY